MRVVVVVPHDPAWSTAFEHEAARVGAALGENAAQIHHIGSTAIRGIYAKPIIDLLIEVHRVETVEEKYAEMERIGYEALGEFGIAGRRYFRKTNDAGVRTHHVHVFAQGSVEVDRHLAFRDFLRTHPARAQEYSALKRALAEKHPDDMEAYMDGKDAFIKDVEREAMAWRSAAAHAATTNDGSAHEEGR